MKIQNCIICDALVPELERQIDRANWKLEKAMKLLSVAIDEGRTWSQQDRLDFMKEVADLKKHIQ